MTDQELDARLEKFAATISSEISIFKSDIGSEIRTEGEITRRHFDVVAEGLKAEIKVIADFVTEVRLMAARLPA